LLENTNIFFLMIPYKSMWINWVVSRVFISS
jgi:hypothetical protein